MLLSHKRLCSVPTLWWISFLQLSSFVGEATSAFQPEQANPGDKYIGKTVKLREFFFGKDVYARIMKVIQPPGVPFKSYQDTQFAVQRDHTVGPLDIVWGSEAELIDNPEEDIKTIEGKFVRIIRPTEFNRAKPPANQPLAKPVKRMQLGFVKECWTETGECMVQVLNEERVTEGHTWKEAYQVMQDPRKKDQQNANLEEKLPRGDFEVMKVQPNFSVLTGAAASFRPGQIVRITAPQTGNEDFDRFVTNACAKISSPAPGRDRDTWLMKYVWPSILLDQIGEFTFEEVTDGEEIGGKIKKTCKEDMEEKTEAEEEVAIEPSEKRPGEPEPRKDIDYSSLKALKEKWDNELGEVHTLITDKLQPAAVHALTEHNKYVGEIWKMYDGVQHFNSALQNFRDNTNILDQESNDKLRLAYRTGYLEADLSNDTARKFNEYSNWREQHMLQKHREALEKHYEENEHIVNPPKRPPHEIAPIHLANYSGPEHGLYYPEIQDNVMYWSKDIKPPEIKSPLKLFDQFGEYDFGDLHCRSVEDLQQLIAQFGAIVEHLAQVMPAAHERSNFIDNELRNEFSTHPLHREMSNKYEEAVAKWQKANQPPTRM